MISWRMAAAWVAALTMATVLAWQIVGLADSQVGERPVAVAPSLTTTSEDDGTSATQGSSPSSTSGFEATTTTARATTTSPATPSTSTSTPSTSSSSASPSETTAADPWEVRTVTTTGGVVVLRHRPEEVDLVAATPAPGFSVEVDDSGPSRVRVEFESDAADYRVEARWEGGQLTVEVDD